MGDWAKVTTEPLGLAGFALFLVFAYIGKVKSSDTRKWPAAVAFACAALTLVGGFALAYVQATKPVPTSDTNNKPATIAQPPAQVTQSSSGAGSPNVQGVKGDVNITVDASDGKTQPDKNKPKP